MTPTNLDEQFNQTELVIIKSKWYKITEALSKLDSLPKDSVNDIEDFTNFIDKLCRNSNVFEELEENLFSKEKELTNTDVNDMVTSSTGSKDRTIDV